MSLRSWLLAAAAGALLGLMQPVLAQQTAAASEALVENGWDFNKPDTIPGFGSLPPYDGTPVPLK
jgi:hypothetical protein